MANSMEQDKLLQELAYLDQAEYIDKQAYAQLVEIVEGHFGPQKNVGHPPTVFSEKQVEDYWKEQDARKKPDPDTGVGELTYCEVRDFVNEWVDHYQYDLSHSEKWSEKEDRNHTKARVQVLKIIERYYTDTQMDCPSCGKKWDTSKYSACSCGAILQTPDTQEGVEELIRKTWERYATLAPRGVMSPPSSMMYLQFEEAAKQLLSRQPRQEPQGVEEASDFKLAKSRLKAILDNLIDSGYSQADALKDILYVIQDIIRTKRVDEIAKSIAIQMTAENFCPECGTEFLSCCKQLLTRQPQKRVSREWIRRYDRSDGMDREEMLKELGIEVEEK